MKNTTIRLGGVPEHFNLPVHLAKEKGLLLTEVLTWNGRPLKVEPDK